MMNIYQDRMSLFSYGLLAGGGGASLSGQSLLLCSKDPQMWHPTDAPRLQKEKSMHHTILLNF